MSSPQVEGEEYWRQRPANDIRKDWRNDGGSWIEEYVKSVDHPHRKLIVDAIASIADPPRNVVELGCNTGPNLVCIQKRWPDRFQTGRSFLVGIEINQVAAQEAQRLLPNAIIHRQSILDVLSWLPPRGIVLSDAVLMYTPPDEIEDVMDGIARVASMGVVLCEWFDESEGGVVKDHHWSRNYPKLLEDRGFQVISRQLCSDEWPTSSAWQRNGCITIARRP